MPGILSVTQSGEHYLVTLAIQGYRVQVSLFLCIAALDLMGNFAIVFSVAMGHQQLATVLP